MTRIWVGTSWKMNKTVGEAVAYATRLRELRSEGGDAQVFIVPPFTALWPVGQVLHGSPVLFGAQNMHWQERGAWTGEISPVMVKDCGAQLVELGHSERRAAFGETDYTVNLKVHAALAHGLIPLICVGETAQEKEAGVSSEILARQVKIALHDVPRERFADIVIAYEPVWAIGDQGTPAEPEYANAMHGVIRQAAAEVGGDAAASALPILYGGSVNLDNAAALVSQPQIDGLFIGRAAWQVESFIELIRTAEQAVRGKRSPAAVSLPAG